MNKTLFIVLVLLIGLGAWAFTSTSVEEGEMATTTPGSSAEVPLEEEPSSGTATVTARIDQGAGALGVTVVPLEVLEDSRCPIDVNCVWAGTVRLRALLSSGLGEGEQVFVLGEPITTEAEEVTLTAVAPDPVSTEAIASGDYVFTFTIRKR